MNEYWHGFPYRVIEAPYGLPDCWAYQGPKMKAGRGMRYGYPVINGKHVLIHRYLWERTNNAKIPKGKVIRHRCDNSICINQDHLELGTQRDNAMDAVKRGRHGNSIKSAISCRKGHLRTPENTIERMRKGRNGYPDHIERHCRVCAQIRWLQKAHK